MSGGGPDQRQRVPGGSRVWLPPLAILALVLFGAIALGLHDLARSRDARIEHARHHLRERALMLAQHAARAFDSADHMLRSVQIGLEAAARGVRPPPEELQQRLRRLAEQSPVVRSLVVFDATGAALLDSISHPPRPLFAGRQGYFSLHRDQPEVGFVLGAPFRGRLDGRWVIPATRRLSAADGSFAGIVAAAIESEHFTELYRALDEGAGSTLAIWRGDGRIIVRHPHDDALLAREAMPAALRAAAWAESEEGPENLLVDYPAGGPPSLLGYRKIDGHDLIAVASQSQADILAPWRRQAGIYLLAFLTLTAFGLVLTLLQIRQRAGRALLERERARAAQYFRMQFEQSTDAQYLVTAGRIADCNRAALELFGADARERFLALQPSDLFPPFLPDGRDALAAAGELQRQARMRGFNRFEWTGRRLDGSEFPAEVTLTPVAIGAENAMLAVWRNLTETKRQASALAENLALLDTALGSLSQGLSMFDGEHRLLACNRRFAELLDLPPETIRKGARFEDIVRMNAERGEYGPGDVETVVAERTRAAFGGKPVTFERTRPDGTVIQAHGMPMPGGGIVTVYSDITELVRASQAAQTAEQRLREAIETVNEAFVLFDADDRLVLCNDIYRDWHRRLGVELGEGMTFREIVEATYRAAPGERSETEILYAVEERMRMFRADVPPFEQTFADGRTWLISDRMTRDGGVVGIRIDITSQKRQEHQLERHIKDVELSRALLAQQAEELARLAEDYAQAKE
ncbi:MAG: PAS-domain containing protein, partial [Alphaproteobacteria bacterium]|nr:PAS-domain containing protein [Alphaproteobacteria bacterium]